MEIKYEQMGSRLKMVVNKVKRIDEMTFHSGKFAPKRSPASSQRFVCEKNIVKPDEKGELVMQSDTCWLIK